MSELYKRGELHIITDNPMDYELPQGVLILVTYTDTIDALCRDQKIIYTTQLAVLSHLWIKAGYDIFLYDNEYTVLFGDEYLDAIDGRYNALPYDYMQTLYMWGDLYQIPDDED